MNLPQISVAGDSYEIGVGLGRQPGRGLGELLELVPRFRTLRAWIGSDRLAGLEAAGRAVFPKYIQTIEGIAEGASMPFEDVFLWNCRGGLPVAETGAGTEGCTTISVPGSAGQPAVIAHNEDGEREFDGHCFLVTIAPSDGAKFTSFCYPGLLPGHAFAVNEHGLVQTINHIRSHEMKAGIPRHLITRAVMDRHSLDDALAVLSRDDRASAFHHNLMQAGDDRLLSVEAPAGGCDVKRVTQPHVHANHLLRFPGHGQTVSPSSEDRQRRADALLSEQRPREPLGILGDQEPDAWPICRKSKRGPDTGYTLATDVFETEDGRIAWRVHPSPEAPALNDGIVVSHRTAA